MNDWDRLRNKIAGAWTGKISGGTFGMPTEGKNSAKIRKFNPPLTGWGQYHQQVVNDDEQFEFIALLALEAASDEEIKELIQKKELFSPKQQGLFWEQNLHPLLVFTAEKAALENATKHSVPWENAGDEIHQNKYQNPYFDWIGAQMKGELFGMFVPAWGWHADLNPTPDNDFIRLEQTFEFAYQDALLDHREIALVGEIFVAAMIAIGIDYDPSSKEINIKYPPPKVRWLEKTFIKNLELPQNKQENIIIEGITTEIFKSDIRRLKAALFKFKKLNSQWISTYFRFIDPILDAHDTLPDPRQWELVWNNIVEDWNKYEKELEQDAKNRLGHNKEWLNERLKVLKKSFWVHTTVNNAAIVIGLIYGDGDFGQTILNATLCGFDTDCNAGNAGAIIGSYLGLERIPMYYRRVIRDELIPALKNFSEFTLQGLTDRTIIQIERITKILKK